MTVMLYHPPPLDEVGLAILREVRDSTRGRGVCWTHLGRSWTHLGRIPMRHHRSDRVLRYAMVILGTASWIRDGRKEAEFRDLRGYVEVRHPTAPIENTRGVGREARVRWIDSAEFRLTSVGLAELDIAEREQR